MTGSLDTAHLDHRRCPVCGDRLDARPVTTCPTCETPAHRECAGYIGGCARFACPLAASLRGRLALYVETRLAHSAAQSAGLALLAAAWMLKTVLIDLFASHATGLFVLLLGLQGFLLTQALGGLTRELGLIRRLRRRQLDPGELGRQIALRGLLPRDGSAARGLGFLAVFLALGGVAALAWALVMAGSAASASSLILVSIACLVQAWAQGRSARAVAEGTRLANLWHEELALMGGNEAAALELLAAEATGGLDKKPAPSTPPENPS